MTANNWLKSDFLEEKLIRLPAMAFKSSADLNGTTPTTTCERNGVRWYNFETLTQNRTISTTCNCFCKPMSYESKAMTKCG